MKKHLKTQVLLGLAMAFIVLMIGCSSIDSVSSDARMGIQIGQNGRIAKLYDTFDGIERRSLELDGGQRVCLDYQATVNKGRLTFKLLDPTGAAIWQRVLSESASGTKEIVCESPGGYEIIIQGQSTVGSFDIAWDSE